MHTFWICVRIGVVALVFTFILQVLNRFKSHGKVNNSIPVQLSPFMHLKPARDPETSLRPHPNTLPIR
jgi:hypothetical protein